jgi:hypothetical protein
MPAPAVRFLVHRGRVGGPSPDLLAENTVSAVRAALRLEPAYVEVDTRNLADGTIALRHNPKVVLVAGRPATPLAALTREQFAAANEALFRELSFEALLEVIAQAPAETRFVLDLKDLDGQQPEANLRTYFDAIAARGLERRVVLISWNVWALRGLMDLNRARPPERRLRLGLSFVPLPLPSWTFRPLAWLVNHVFRGSFGAVIFYNLADAPQAALCRNGLFPICLERIATVRQSLGEDAILCFHKVFARSWFRRTLGPLLGSTRDLADPPRAVWLYDYDSLAEVRALTPRFVAGLAQDELVLFSRILDRFDFKAEERRLSQAAVGEWRTARIG